MQIYKIYLDYQSYNSIYQKTSPLSFAIIQPHATASRPQTLTEFNYNSMMKPLALLDLTESNVLNLPKIGRGIMRNRYNLQNNFVILHLDRRRSIRDILEYKKRYAYLAT